MTGGEQKIFVEVITERSWLELLLYVMASLASVVGAYLAWRRRRNQTSTEG